MKSTLGPRCSSFLALPFWIGLCLLTVCGCGSGIATISVAVPAMAAEDLNGPCTYELLLPGSGYGYEKSSAFIVRGVLVIYERGDTRVIYEDETIRNVASTQQYAMIWAHECNARTTGDLQSNASLGPARTLFTALSMFAQKTGHQELANSNLILYGFSAAGVLTATMERDYPERLLGAIFYAAGSAYLNLDQVIVGVETADVPTLILANALDLSSGTRRSYDYFQRGRAAGAFWGFGVQNQTGHCCNLSTRGIIVPWMQAVMSGDEAPAVRGNASSNRTQAAVSNSNFVCTKNGIVDAQHDTNCSFTAASVGKSTSSSEAAGWLPDPASENAWLTWVTNPGTN